MTGFIPAVHCKGVLYGKFTVLQSLAAVTEESLGAVALAAMVFLLLVESFVRPWFGFAVPGSLLFVRQLTLWVALLGGALAAGHGRLLALATGVFLRDRRTRNTAEGIATAVAAAVSAILCVAAVELVRGEYLYGTIVAAGLPAWLAQLPLPIGFGLIAVRMVRRVQSPVARGFAALGLVAGIAIALRPEPLAGMPAWPLAGLVIAAGALGAPLFSVLGGLAVFLFMTAGTSPISGSSARTNSRPIPRCRRCRCSRSRGSFWPRETPPLDCCACSGRSSDGCLVAPRSSARSSVPSSRSSPAAPA
jgi:TRAP-type C4-dicarboxylate transport system permease small subunit